jgi:hypothetical protein
MVSLAYNLFFKNEIKKWPGQPSGLRKGFVRRNGYYQHQCAIISMDFVLCVVPSSDRMNDLQHVGTRLQLNTIFQERFLGRPDLGVLNPLFRFNIFRWCFDSCDSVCFPPMSAGFTRFRLHLSSYFNDYVFDEMKDPASNDIFDFEALRGDTLELQLFQVLSCPASAHSHDGSDVHSFFFGDQSMSVALKVDVAAISSLYQMPRATIPQRNARLDWAYGDVREVLAVSQQFTESLQAYCQNRQGNLYEACINDTACSDSQWPYPQGFPNLF